MLDIPPLESLPADKLMTLAEAAKYFPSAKAMSGRMHVGTLYNWIRLGYRGVKLGHRKTGHWVRVTPADLLKFMAEVKKKAPPPKTRKYWKVLQDAGATLDNYGV